jgi:YggT family protein
VKDAIYFLISTLLELVVLTFILRLLLQTVRADFYNPISQAILRITNPLVIPARRAIPSWGRLDMPTLIIIIVLQLAATLTLSGLQGAFYGVPFPGMAALLYLTFLSLIRLLVQFYFFALLVYALMSWFGPQQNNPLSGMLRRLCDPLLGPVRRVLPPIGGLDFSVLAVLLALQALMIALR